MAIRLSDIPVAPARGVRLSSISLFPSGADPDKALGFVRDIVPPAPTADRVDPKDVGGGPAQQLFRPRWAEFVDAAARGIATVGSAFKQGMAFLTEMPRPTAPGMKPAEPLTKEQEVARDVSVAKLREGAEFLWALGKHPELAAQNIDLASKALNLIGETIPYITATTAAYVVAGPVGGFTVGSMVEGNTAYRTAVDYFTAENKGEPLTPEQETLAKKIGVGVGVVSGAIEAFGGRYAERFLRSAANKIKSKVLKVGTIFGIGTVIEALEEGGQEIAAITGEESYRDVDWGERVTRVLGAMAGGGFLGGIMGGGRAALRGTMRAVTPEAPMRLENVPVFPAEERVAEAPPALEKPMFRAAAEKVEVAPEAKTLKELAEQIIDKKVTGNRDQIVVNWVSEKYKDLSEADIDKKIDSAIRNFDTTIQKVERERLKIEAQPVVAPEAKEVSTEIVSPKLYIGNVTKRMKKVFGEIFGVAPEQVKGFTEKGFPTKRTGIEVTRAEAQKALDILTEDLNKQFRENRIRTETQLSLANAHWGDVVQLRKALDLPAIPRPWKVIRAAKHLILEFENLKTRIQMAVQPSRMFQAGLTVQQVLSATMRKAEVVSSKAWLESTRYIVKAHKDLARYAAEKLKGLDITQSERDRLLSFVARGRTDVQKQLAIAGVEMLAEKADKRTAFIELREEVSKIKSRIGKTMQEKGIRPEYARKLNALIDSFRTTKLSLWRLSDIGSLKNYLSNLKEGISSDPTIDETYAAKLAELLVPEARLRQLEQLSKSAVHLLKALDIRTITTEIKRLVNLNDLKNKIYLGQTARHAAEYLNKAVAEQKKVKDNSKIVKQQTAWTTSQKGGMLREVWRYVGGIHNQDVKTLVWNIEGGKQGVLSDILVEGMREGRRIESEHEKKVAKYITGFLTQHKITPSDLAKLSSTFQQVFRDPQQKARKLFGAAVPTYKIGDTNWVMAELMSIYLHTKNDFSLKAMVNEGIASILEEKGAMSADDLAQATTLVEENRVAKLLTEMYEYLAENINKPAINAVSLVLKGIEIADVSNYFTVERRSPGKIAGNQEFRISLLESQGFLQERTGSKNPIIIRDFFAVLNASIKGVAEYVGMAQPFRAAHTILSYKPLIKSIDTKGREVHRRHVNTLIERAESKLRPRGKVEAIFGKVLRAVPRAVLASPGIMGGQIMSEISYAATDIPTKYLFRMPVPSEKQVDRVGELFAWAWVRKNLGATSIETRNISSTDALLRTFTGKKAIINLPTQGINYVDMKAITFGWLAVERWVKDTTDLTGDAFYEEVNKRAHKAISESQPMFETENRSILTSSENVIARSFVMFRSYVDQTLRIFARAHQGRLNGTMSKGKSAQMMGAVLAGFVAWKAMRLLIDALIFGKKKDPYEIAKDIAFSPIRALNLVGYQVERQVSRILDIWVGRRPKSRYWDTEFENLVLSTINEVWKATKDFADAMAYYGTDEVYKSGKNKGKLKSDVLLEKAIVDLILSIGKILGLPTPVIRKALFSIKKKEKKSMFKTGKSIFKKRAG